jgi:parallel beta-helix repeat protein
MAYSATNATFRGNNVSGYAKGGFVGNGYPLDLSMPKPNVTIDNNVVTGPPYDPALALAPNGIQLGWGATGKVTNNTVTHHGSPGTKWGGTGVLVQSSPNVLVEGNKAVDNQDYGIATAGYESYGGSYVTGAILKDNTIERNGQGIRIERRSVDTSIQNNTIITNKDGIHVGNAPSASLAPPIGAIINKKTVCPTDSITSTNVQDGIYVVDALLASLIPPVNTDIHNNLIYDNTDFGAFVENNPLQEEVDASSNWWGSCDGPAPYGAGNAVSGNINVLPFLCISKAPIPVITATPLAGFAPLTVTFDGSQSYATESGAVIVDWIWNFGEGSLNEYGVGLQHTYNSAGVYTATLTVKDSFEKRGSTQIKIKVYNVGDLRIDFYSEKNSIKANGKEATYIFAYVHDPEGLVLEDLGLLFGIDNGSLIGSISFDPLTGKYSQQISSGTPGIGNATAILGGTVVGNLQIAYIWPQSPVDLKAIYNGGAFVYHYNLTWSPNPLNSMFDIVKYNIYRDGNLIGSTNTTEFQDTPDLKNVTYGVTAVDSEGDESEIVVAVKQ